MRQNDLTTTPTEAEVDLRDYLAVLKRRKYLIGLTVVVVVAVVLVLSSLQTPLYQATSEVLLRQRASEQVLQPGPVTQDRNAVDTEIEVMRSRSVREAVRKALGFNAGVSIAGRGDTFVVAITAVSPDPVKAARIANVYAETYVSNRRQGQVADFLSASGQVQDQLRELDQETAVLDDAVRAIDDKINGASVETANSLRADRDRLTLDQQGDRASIATRRATYQGQLDQLRLSSDLSKSGSAQIVSAAVPPGSPFKPTPRRNAAIALVIGMLLGVALAFLRDYLDDSISSREDLERTLPGVDVLAVVPQHAEWKDKRVASLISITSPHSPTAEAYRTLRTSMQFVGIDRPIRIAQITSPKPGEGKSTTLANLGVQLNRTGQRVILVDCDLRRPRLHNFFGLDNTVGFTSVLLGEASLAETLQSVGGERDLVILPSGPIPPNPSELLSGRRTQEVLRQLGEEAAIVLVDSPPVLPVSDALVLSQVVDATMLVLSAGSTTKREAQRAYELLDQIEAPLIGVMLNAVDGSSRDYSGSGSYGGYGAYGGYGYSGYGYGGYGYGGGYGHRSRSRRKLARLRNRVPWRKAPAAPKPDVDVDIDAESDSEISLH